MEHHEHGAETFRSLACLPALVGAWREPRWWPVPHDNMVQLGRALTDLDPPLKALVVYNSNPATIAPQQNLVLADLARENLFTVVIEHVMPDTARMADVVLPATTQVEHHDVLWSWGHTYLTWNEPAVAPVGEALSNAEIFRRLGRRLGYDDPAFSTPDATLAEAAVAPLGADRVAEIKRRGWLRMDGEQHLLPYARGGFAARAAQGLNPLPGYRSAREGPHGDSETTIRIPSCSSRPRALITSSTPAWTSTRTTPTRAASSTGSRSGPSTTAGPSPPPCTSGSA